MTHEISNTIALESDAREDIDLYLMIALDDFSLNVYNKHRLIEAEDLQEFIGLMLIEIEETDLEITLNFEGKSICIDMSDDGFTGPEALLLRGPNNLAIVWN